jgi:hypothetical protein
MNGLSDLAALTTGADLKTWILAIAGNVFVALLVIRGLGAFLKRDYGEMATLFVAGVLLAGLIWFPDGAVALMKAIWQKVVGA